jgi:ferredoxin--NADP+ reductase
MAAEKLIYYPTTTREPSNRMGRVTNLMESGALFDDLGLPHLSAETDKVMICGSMAMNLDMKQVCSAAGLSEGANSQPGDFVVEKAFVG